MGDGEDGCEHEAYVKQERERRERGPQPHVLGGVGNDPVHDRAQARSPSYVGPDHLVLPGQPRHRDHAIGASEEEDGEGDPD